MKTSLQSKKLKLYFLLIFLTCVFSLNANAQRFVKKTLFKGSTVLIIDEIGSDRVGELTTSQEFHEKKLAIAMLENFMVDSGQPCKEIEHEHIDVTVLKPIGKVSFIRFLDFVANKFIEEVQLSIKNKNHELKTISEVIDLKWWMENNVNPDENICFDEFNGKAVWLKILPCFNDRNTLVYPVFILNSWKRTDDGYLFFLNPHAEVSTLPKKTLHTFWINSVQTKYVFTSASGFTIEPEENLETMPDIR